MNRTPCKICVLLLTAIFLLACPGEDKPVDDVNTLRPNVNRNVSEPIQNANANIVEDNEAKLRELIKLPFEPTGDSPWRIENPGKIAGNKNPKGRKLTTVLKFSNEDTEKLLARVRGKNPPAKVSIDAENWFPAELIAKSDTAGDTTLRGNRYPAADFLKTPYTSGNLIHIEDADFFILILQAEQ